MGGGSNRILTLLNATTTACPAVLLQRRTHCSLLSLRHRRSLLLTISSAPRHFPLHRRFQSLNSDHHLSPSYKPHPWPEWSRLLEALSSAGYFDRSLQSVADEDDFARSAAVCLDFARERSGLVRLLSRRDVEIVASDAGEVTTVDLMRFILSHVSNLGGTHAHNRERIESSARKLLSEMAKLCYVVPDPSSFGLAQDKFAQRNGEPAATRASGRNIEMKRGDWICPRCRFMNFARNMKCIECEEARPRTQLTGGEWECPQCDFFNYGRNTVCLRCDCKCPRENVTGHENASNLNRVDDIDAKKDDDFPDIMPLRKGVNRFVVSTRKTQLERRLTNSQYEPNFGNGSTVAGHSGSDRSSTYVPFVPLPADMFAKKPENTGKEVGGGGEAVATNKAEAISQEPSDEDESNKDEDSRWFEKVTELHHSIDGSSANSEDDFPEIMPMRKGENRFVVSKKKDRSLTSPAYKRQMAMEQASSTKFVPFVPFPPDYFAKKNDQNQTPSNSAAMPQTHSDRAQPIDKRSGFQNSNSEPLVGKVNANKTDTSYEPLVNRNFSPNTSDKEIPSKTQNLTGSSFQQFDDQKIRGGKSLEGSAVKESDPLDMSEEAKAERWFRRVAQIKDISELSQIPDEDFPSIMPMRKGVNRFVVSKRKTPLERRLTSPQYRRNFPPVSSDPVKDNE